MFNKNNIVSLALFKIIWWKLFVVDRKINSSIFLVIFFDYPMDSTLAPATKNLVCKYVSYLLNWFGFKPMKANARLAQTSARSGLDSSLQIWWPIQDTIWEFGANSYMPKGQLISKCLFGVIISTKIPMKFRN